MYRLIVCEAAKDYVPELQELNRSGLDLKNSLLFGEEGLREIIGGGSNGKSAAARYRASNSGGTSGTDVGEIYKIYARPGLDKEQDRALFGNQKYGNQDVGNKVGKEPLMGSGTDGLLGWAARRRNYDGRYYRYFDGLSTGGIVSDSTAKRYDTEHQYRESLRQFTGGVVDIKSATRGYETRLQSLVQMGGMRSTDADAIGRELARVTRQSVTKLSIVLMSISVRERRKTKLLQTTFYHFRNRGAVIKLPIVHGRVPKN